MRMPRYHHDLVHGERTAQIRRSSEGSPHTTQLGAILAIGPAVGTSQPRDSRVASSMALGRGGKGVGLPCYCCL